MLYTASFNNISLKYRKNISIVKDGNKKLGYKGNVCEELVPKTSLSKIKYYDINTSKTKQEKYIEKYYLENLKEIDPKTLYNKLDGKVLLSYEDNDKFSHRHIIASWFELFLDTNVSEIKRVNKKVQKLSRPQYIKDILEEVIKSDLDCKYEYLRTYYLINESIKLDKKADYFFNQGKFDMSSKLRLLSIELLEEAEKCEMKSDNTYKRVRSRI